MLNQQRLREVELIARLLMAVILLVAGTSKFFSDGGFLAYYSSAFQGDLRIVMPRPLIDVYLSIIPFIEVGLGFALLFARLKRFAVLAWFLFMLSLLVGHYLLQEWSAVNQMLDYFFLGFLVYVLPTYNFVGTTKD